MQLYKDFFIKKTTDHQTKEVRYVATMQGLRLTAVSLSELKAKIDERSALRAEMRYMEFKRTGAAFNDYTAMYMEPHEVNQLVNHVTAHGVNHYA